MEETGTARAGGRGGALVRNGEKGGWEGCGGGERGEEGGTLPCIVISECESGGGGGGGGGRRRRRRPALWLPGPLHRTGVL